MPTSVLRQRKQPTQTRAKATYQAIVDAAAQIIARDGLDAFNTNAVAERAGVSIGSLYQYFPGKDAIMAALIRRTQQDRAQALGAILTQRHDTLADLVRAAVRAINTQHREQSLLAAAIDHEEARLPVQDELDAFLNSAGEALRTLFDRYPDELTNIDPDRAARTLPVLVRSIVDCWANLDPPQPVVAEEEAIRATCGYLGITAP